MVVEEIMTRDPISIEASSPLSEAIRVLFELDVRHVPVIDNGELTGMLSDRDLRGLHSPGLSTGSEIASFLERPVSQHMTGCVVAVGPEAEVSDVIELMVDRKIGAVAVVDGHDRALLGIVSYIDVLKAAASLF